MGWYGTWGIDYNGKDPELFQDLSKVLIPNFQERFFIQNNGNHLDCQRDLSWYSADLDLEKITSYLHEGDSLEVEIYGETHPYDENDEELESEQMTFRKENGKVIIEQDYVDEDRYRDDVSQLKEIFDKYPDEYAKWIKQELMKDGKIKSNIRAAYEDVVEEYAGSNKERFLDIEHYFDQVDKPRQQSQGYREDINMEMTADGVCDILSEQNENANEILEKLRSEAKSVYFQQCFSMHDFKWNPNDIRYKEASILRSLDDMNIRGQQIIDGNEWAQGNINKLYEAISKRSEDLIQYVNSRAAERCLNLGTNEAVAVIRGAYYNRNNSEHPDLGKNFIMDSSKAKEFLKKEYDNSNLDQEQSFDDFLKDAHDQADKINQQTQDKNINKDIGKDYER